MKSIFLAASLFLFPHFHHNGITKKELKNATYYIGEQVKLSNGVFEAKDPYEYAYFVGSVTGLYGDRPIGAVHLTYNDGGSGILHYLAIMVRENDGKIKNVGTAFLGDRVEVKSLKLRHFNIHLKLKVQQGTDGLCCPTKIEYHSYAFIGGVDGDLVGIVMKQVK